jgi:hypothetical protein
MIDMGYKTIFYCQLVSGNGSPVWVQRKHRPTSAGTVA